MMMKNRYYQLILLWIWLLGGTACCEPSPQQTPPALNTFSKAISPWAHQQNTAAREFVDLQAPPLGSNIVFIVIDTLRADRLGSYGYGKNTSPNLDKFAQESTLFHRFYAASPWTAPSFGTMFTGVSPSVHRGGTVLNHTDSSDDKAQAKRLKGFSLYPISTSVQTMAQLLSCCVDVTAAIVNNPFLHPSLGYNRGFSQYKYTPKRLPAKQISDMTIEWLSEHSSSQFMLLIHYMDTHQPYDPDDKYRKEFFPGDSGRLSIPIAQRFGELKKMKLTPTEIAFLKGAYNAQIREVDTQVGRVLDTLKDKGLLDNSWVVVTSDHGEEHFEHGSYFHGLQYEDEVARVPLLIRAPGGKWGAGNQVVYSASHQDLLPTFLEWFGVSIPAYVEGKSLVSLMTGEEKTDRQCYMENSMLRDDPHSQIELSYRKHALFDGRYKTIQSLDGRHTNVYDLDNDSSEQNPIAPIEPGYYKSIRSLHQSYQQQQRRAASLPLDQPARTLPSDVSKSLENLGYIKQ